MKNNRKSKLKNRKGSVSLLVAITIFTFLVILMGGYVTIMILRQSQYESNSRIQEIYGKDVERIDEIYESVSEIINSWNKQKQVNEPKLLTGMTPIKFTMPTNQAMGETVTTKEDDEEWYEYGTTYETKRWANAQTEDGSMWVWIPRFAYKINSEEQTTDVVFLLGKTDYYYDEDGEMQKAQRCTEKDEYVETDSSKTDKYTVHPAFTDESNIDFRNGGWDEELTGIWVAKFEAGYASGNNDAEVVASNVNYTQASSWVAGVERPKNEDGTGKGEGSEIARNWLDGIYGENQTAIKYPVFMPTTYSMNYINNSDSYNITRALTDSGNIYGFNSTDTDSHLMKNSEWGAVSYLSASIYGQFDKEITINNISLNSGGSTRIENSGKSGVDSVYGVTGCTTTSTNEKGKVTTISAINSVTGNTANANGVYVWNQKTGQNASTTGTIYGIYDISGGTWEKTSSYVANENDTLKKYGESMTFEKDTLKEKSTKYVTVYPHNSEYDNKTISRTDSNLKIASQNNFANNTKIYGDSVRETTLSNAGTSNSGWNYSSWNDDYSHFAGLNAPFFFRGGHYWNGSSTGAFAFYRSDGSSMFNGGFRAVLIAK